MSQPDESCASRKIPQISILLLIKISVSTVLTL